MDVSCLLVASNLKMKPAYGWMESRSMLNWAAAESAKHVAILLGILQRERIIHLLCKQRESVFSYSQRQALSFNSIINLGAVPHFSCQSDFTSELNGILSLRDHSRKRASTKLSTALSSFRTVPKPTFPQPVLTQWEQFQRQSSNWVKDFSPKPWKFFRS